MPIVIRTNNHKRDVLYWQDLSEKEQAEFDWISSSDTLSQDDAEFFRYKGNVYCLSDIPRIEHYPNSDLDGWDGIVNDTYFSGILIKYPGTDWSGDPDFECVIVANYYCKSDWED